MADTLSVDQQKAMALMNMRKRASEASSKPDTLSPKLNAVERGAGERALGTEELINNLGIGKHIGLPDNELLESAKQDATKQGKGTGTLGFIGETAGDPLSWVGGEALAGAKGAKALAKVGAGLGAAGGATEGGKDLEENAKNTAIGAVEGAVMAPAVPALAKGAVGAVKGANETGKMMMEGYGARSHPQLKEAAGKIRDEADEHYATMRSENARIAPEHAQKLLQDAGKDLSKELSDINHPSTVKALRRLQEDAKNGIDLERLDQHRRVLSGVVNNNRVGKPEDARMAGRAINAIDDAVDKLKPEHLSTNSKKAIDALNSGRATWSKARKFETVTDAIEKADGDPNKLKSLLDNLANNKKKTAGWTQAEKDALREAARNTTAEGLLKMAGKFGIDIGSGRAAAKGNALPALEAIGGASIAGGGVPAFGAIAGGTAAKYGQKLAARGKTERLLQTIEGKDPLGGYEEPLTQKPKAITN